MSDKAPAKPRKPLRKRWWMYTTPGTIVLLLIVVGPWPTHSENYVGSDYAAATNRRIDSLQLAPARGPLKAGAAVVDITPPVGEPMAGFSNRSPNRSDGIGDKLSATAVTVSNGAKTVTIIGGEILLFLPELRQAVLDRTHLAADEIYFTSTHTHSGAGGYASRWIEQLVLGSYDEKILTRLADDFAEAVSQSRERLSPCEIAAGRYVPQGEDRRAYASSRYPGSADAFAGIDVIRLTKPGTSHAAVATIVVATPHGTCYDSSNRRISGDYPGLVQRLLADDTGAPCLFIAGSVGGTAPAGKEPRGQARAQDVGQQVYHRAAATTMRALPVAEATLASAILDVDLPPPQFRFAASWRLSPVITRYLHDRHSYIHVLRLNDMVLLGMPSDYSCELTGALADWAANRGVVPVITGFNGDYVGYLLPQKRYETIDSLETRHENLCGPTGGDYFNDLARRLIEKAEK